MQRPPGLSVTHTIVQSLGRAIVSGHYSECHPLPTELDLSRHYGVSRGAIREAVKILSAKGMIDARPRRGISIRQEQGWDFLDPDVLAWHMDRRISRHLLREMIELRLAIEPKAAALAAGQANAKQRTAIRDTLLRITASDKGEDDAVAAEVAFAKALLRASGNRFYNQLGAITESALRPCFGRSDCDALTPVYKNIWDAVTAGDPVEAEALVREHIQGLLEAARDTSDAAEHGEVCTLNCADNDILGDNNADTNEPSSLAERRKAGPGCGPRIARCRRCGSQRTAGVRLPAADPLLPP